MNEILQANFALTVILFVVGLVLIILGGDRFVDASVSISKRFGIPQVVIGATIVSLGTTLPEVLVSTTAAFQGQGNMAVGNAFGSIVCNTLLIAAITQAVRPSIGIKKSDIGWRAIMFFAVYVVVSAFGLVTGELNRLLGVGLLVCFGVYAYLSMKNTGSEASEEVEQASGEGDSIAKSAITMVVCAAMLFVGAKLLVDCGTIIAVKVGVPEGVIAVTFVALGTSLPELVTAITALVKGHQDVSLGNIIGANTLNLLLVLGIPAAVTGIQITDKAFYLAAPFGLGAMLLLLMPFYLKGRGYKWQGMLMLVAYAVYTVLSFTVVGI